MTLRLRLSRNSLKLGSRSIRRTPCSCGPTATYLAPVLRKHFKRPGHTIFQRWSTGRRLSDAAEIRKSLNSLGVTQPSETLPGEVDVLIEDCRPTGLMMAAQLATFPDIKLMKYSQMKREALQKMNRK